MRAILDSSFTTAKAVDSGAEFSTLAATTDNVSALPADEVNLFILSNSGDGGRYSLWKGDELYQLKDALEK